MDSPITKIREQILHLTEAQREVGNFVIQHPNDVAFLTIDQLARRVGVSTTTIMRMSTNLGYSGYAELQKGLQEQLKTLTEPKSRLESNLKKVSQDNLWMNVVTHHMEHIQMMMESISPEVLDEVVEKILKGKRIFCTSVRSGMPVGNYITHGLNRILGNCRLIVPDNSEWVDDVVGFGQSDVVIATSFPRYAKRIIDFVSLAKKQNATIISITDSYSSPIAPYSDFLLPCDSSSIAFHNSPILAMVVADYIISAVAIKNSEVTKEHLDKVNKILTKLDYHVK